MLIFKIIGVGIIGAVSAVLIKQYKPEISIIVSISACLVIIGMCLPYLTAVMATVKEIAEKSGINTVHMKIVLKIIGISYLCHFASDICKDAGEAAISGKIELGGKIVILTLSMPIIYSLLEIVNKIINF